MLRIRRALLGLAALALCWSLGPVAPATSVAGSDACGTRIPKPDGGFWSCTFVDNFSSASLDRRKWVPLSDGFATGETSGGAYACYRDDPSVVSVAKGVANLTVRKVSTPVSCGYASPTQYIGGSISTWHLFSQQYGRFEARMKVPDVTGPGLQEAFWLWPDDRYGSTSPWPSSGEIDVAETYANYPGLAVPFLHYGSGTGNVGVDTAYCPAVRGQWNTYRLEWSPTRLEVFVNGTSCLVNTSADIAFQKRYIVQFTAGLGYGSNAYTGATALPATTSIDYVKVWQ